MDFQLWQGMGPPSDSVSLERNTLGSTRTSCNPATRDRPLIQLECTECLITNGWDQQPFPKAYSSDRRRNKWNFSRSVIIHPNGNDPHSHAACPIFVIFPVDEAWGHAYLSFAAQSLWMPHCQTFVHTSSFWVWTKPNAPSLSHPSWILQLLHFRPWSSLRNVFVGSKWFSDNLSDPGLFETTIDISG